MAILEVKKEMNKDLLQLYRKINYITDCCSTNLDLIYGSSVSVTNTYTEMVATKMVFDQTENSAYRHFVLSLKEDEEISLSDFAYLCIEVCELLSRFYGNYQVLMAVHINTKKLHAHYVANTIDYLTGQRLDLNWRRLEELKYGINLLLHNYNLSLIGMVTNQ